MKKITVTGLLLALLSFPLFAQDPGTTSEPAPAPAEPELPGAQIDVTVGVVSNYVFRGDDMFQNRAVQEKKQYGSNTGEWALQPNIKFNTPVDGLYFNVWGSFAMAGREDQDVDGVIQSAPGGSNLLLEKYSPGDQQAAVLGATTTAVPARTALDLALNTNTDTTIGLPQYYKELNGLKRLDEIDFTLGYAKSTKAGVIGFGYVNYSFASMKQKGQTNAALQPGEELFITYALPMLPALTASMYDDVDKNNYYYNLTYASNFGIAEGVTLDYAAGVGYAQGYLDRKVQGIQDVTGKIGVTAYGFSVAFNVAHRPNLHIFDPDANGLQTANWLVGGSSRGDGLIADPSQVGAIYSEFNNAIGNALKNPSGVSSFSYTPRQKLPKNLYFVNFGYTFSFTGA